MKTVKLIRGTGGFIDIQLNNIETSVQRYFTIPAGRDFILIPMPFAVDIVLNNNAKIMAERNFFKIENPLDYAKEVINQGFASEYDFEFIGLKPEDFEKEESEFKNEIISDSRIVDWFGKNNWKQLILAKTDDDETLANRVKEVAVDNIDKITGEQIAFIKELTGVDITIDVE